MSFRTLLSIAALAAALALAPTGAAQAAEGSAEGDERAAEGGSERPPGVPDMNWVGENPDSEEEIMGDDARPAIFMFINFAVFAGLLYYFGGPPLRRYLESRHTLIKDALHEATALRDDAKRKLEEYGRRIEEVDREVEEVIEGVRADAEAEKERIVAEGKEQAERMKRDAESRIAAQFARARREIEQEVAAAAVAAAERILRDKATSDDKTALVDAFVADLQSSRGAGGEDGGGGKS